LEGEWQFGGDGVQIHRHALVRERWPTKFAMRAFLPLRPIWWGLIADSLLFAVVLALALYALVAVRAIVRRRRGRCARCGFPVQSGRCPECGDVEKHA